FGARLYTAYLREPKTTRGCHNLAFVHFAIPFTPSRVRQQSRTPGGNWREPILKILRDWMLESRSIFKSSGSRRVSNASRAFADEGGLLRSTRSGQSNVAYRQVGSNSNFRQRGSGTLLARGDSREEGMRPDNHDGLPNRDSGSRVSEGLDEAGRYGTCSRR